MCSKYYICKLFFETFVHVGERGIGLEEAYHNRIPSDTLYSAIIAALIQLYGDEIKPILNDIIEGRSPFKVSSIFPIVKGKEDILLMPTPKFIPHYIRYLKVDRGLHVSSIINVNDMFKSLRRHFFVDYTFIEKLCSNIDIVDATYDSREDKVSITFADNSKYQTALIRQFDKALINLDLVQTDIFDVYFVEKKPRNKLDRITMASDIYYAKYVKYVSPLYFLIEVREEVKCGFKVVELVRNALKYLEDEGLGGERSIGCGKFKILSFEEYKPPKQPEENYVLYSLGLTAFSLDEAKYVDFGKSYYEFTQRAGWSTTPFSIIRSNVKVFTEGSVFKISKPGIIVEGAIFAENTKPRVVRYYSPVMFKLPANFLRGES